MASIPSPHYPSASEGDSAAPTPEIHEPAAPLLEYHGDTDPDMFYIPKVTGVFALGALATGIFINMVVIFLWPIKETTPEQMVFHMFKQVAIVFGITAVGASLLLVGLKFRDDHTGKVLIAKHWLAALATGALFSITICAPWLAAERSVHVNPFIYAAICMCVMAFPSIAAFWLVRPKREYTLTAAE